MELVMIRHGKTPGNELGRYIGRTDEPLSRTGRLQMERLRERGVYPPVQAVYVSPMLRARQTAELLYPAAIPIVCADLRECDFGEFENRDYGQLKDVPAYREWIDAGGRRGCPGGEEPSSFTQRTCAAFRLAVREAFSKRYGRVAFIVHGGTLMTLFSRFSPKGGSFYDWQAPNGGGWMAQIDADVQELTVISRLDIGETA